MILGTLFAFMVVGTLFWGSNLGWKQVLVFWAAYLCGGLIFSLLFHAPHFAAIYMSVVAIWFVGKAATSHTSML